MEYDSENKNNEGLVEYHLSDTDHDVLRNAPAQAPDIPGSSAVEEIIHHKSRDEILSVTNTALDVLHNASVVVENEPEDTANELINDIIGADPTDVKTADEFVDSTKSIYDYLFSGQVSNDTLTALLWLAKRHQRDLATIVGPDPVNQSYELLQKDITAIIDVREQILQRTGKAGLNFLKEYAAAKKQGKEKKVTAKWLNYLTVQAVAALAPTGRVAKIRPSSQTANNTTKNDGKNAIIVAKKNNKKSVKKADPFEPAVTPSQLISDVSNGNTNKAAESPDCEPPLDKNDDVHSATITKTISQAGKLGNKKISPENSRVCTRGCPVSMVSGEELLEQLDFELPGPLPLTWKRTYRSSHDKDYGLGAGWAAPYFAYLEVKSDKVNYIDGEGRQIPFSRPADGTGCYNNIEQLTLYFDNNNRLRIVNEDGVTQVFQGPKSKKRLHAIMDTNGASIDFHYSDSGRLNRVSDSAGRQLKLEYNITSRLSSVNLLGSKGKPLVQYRYSNQGDLISVVDAAGNAQHFEYQNHIITRRTTKDGFNYYFEWDSHDIHGKCLRNWGERNIYDYRFEYDDINKITKSTDGRGYTTDFHYNELGLITKQIDPEGGVTEFDYDDNGKLLWERDAAGNTTRYGYTENGKLVRIVNALGHTTRLSYDDADRIIALIDAMGQRWRREYDDKGRLARTIDPQGHAVRYQYDDRNNPVTITDAMRRTQRLEWNEKGELQAKIDAAGNKQEYEYDLFGRITKVIERGNQETRYFYDPMGRVTQVFHPNGSSEQLQYTPEGHLTRYIDALGRTTQFRYDGLSQPIERINAHGQTFKYEYDEERNLTALVNENSERHELHYDKNERLVKEIGFDERVQHYGYNAAGHLVSHTDGDDRITQFKRDAIGQLLKKWSSDEDISRFEYDPLGRLVHAINNDADLQFKYNDSGLLIEELQNGIRLQHQYDLNGQRSATTLNKNQRIDFEYNGQGLFKRVAYNGFALSSITRNAQGLEIARTSGATSSFFEYDPMGRLVQQRAMKDQSPILERSYKYDKAGNLRQIGDVKFGKTLFKYDALDRLQAVEGLVSERFAFDPAGNLLDAREAFAGGHVNGNRVKIFQDYRFEYDDVGNLICEKKGRKETRYYYNSQNQLIKIEKNGLTSHYTYDPLGRRIKKKDAFGETIFVWDGNTLLNERRKNLQITYIHEPGSFKPLCQIRDGDVFFYHNDHLGTPYAITDVNGETVWEARYKVYGDVVKYETETIDNHIRFQGQYFDVETGLHYNRNRYYHTVIGRFIHQDPIGLLGGNNHYEYAPNPMSWVDPLGLSAKKGDCPGQEQAIIHFRHDADFSVNLSQHIKQQIIGTPVYSKLQIANTTILSTPKPAAVPTTIQILDPQYTLANQKKLKFFPITT